MFDLKSPPLVWLFLGLRIEKWDFYFFSFGCGCGDLKRRDFWDWLLAMGLMLSLGLVSEKLPFWLGLKGLNEGGSRPQKKNLFSKEAGFGPRVGSRYAKTRPVAIPR